MPEEDRPEFLLDEHLLFLDNLREEAITNMFGAQPYLEAEFPDLTRPEAKSVLMYWMHTFGERHPAS